MNWLADQEKMAMLGQRNPGDKINTKYSADCRIQKVTSYFFLTVFLLYLYFI